MLPWSYTALQYRPLDPFGEAALKRPWRGIFASRGSMAYRCGVTSGQAHERDERWQAALACIRAVVFPHRSWIDGLGWPDPVIRRLLAQ